MNAKATPKKCQKANLKRFKLCTLLDLRVSFLRRGHKRFKIVSFCEKMPRGAEPSFPAAHPLLRCDVFPPYVRSGMSEQEMSSKYICRRPYQYIFAIR